MGTVNHMVRSGDLQIAMIEGTEIVAWCGVRYVPEVWVGTSGSAASPVAPTCARCTDVVDDWREWILLKDEKNRLIREMNAIKRRQAIRAREWREERERAPELVP